MSNESGRVVGAESPTANITYCRHSCLDHHDLYRVIRVPETWGIGGRSGKTGIALELSVFY